VSCSDHEAAVFSPLHPFDQRQEMFSSFSGMTGRADR
jgi:hypothetical protein